MGNLGISAWYRAPMGGLQENIRATALHARSENFDVRLALPFGPFRDSLLAQGLGVIGVDFDCEKSLGEARDYLAPCNVLHAHPGPSRQLLLDLSAKTGAPLFFTVHGAWVDSIAQYADRLAHVFCVSASIRRRVHSLIPTCHDRISIAPNGVDFTHFDAPSAVEARTIVVASRFDADKRNVVDLVRLMWERQAAEQDFDVEWIVAGQGTLIGELHEAAESLYSNAGKRLVAFDGWITSPQLAKRYSEASAIVAAGRGAMEAVAMGRPGIAVGSGGACPLFDMPGLLAATECNFGGLGSAALADLDIPSLWTSLSRASSGGYADFGREGSAFIREHLHVDAINARMFERYRDVLSA